MTRDLCQGKTHDCGSVPYLGSVCTASGLSLRILPLSLPRRRIGHVLASGFVIPNARPRKTLALLSSGLKYGP